MLAATKVGYGKPFILKKESRERKKYDIRKGLNQDC
jgi:hypothetical protein